jgi:lysophospholipase L1-like esterase
MLFIVLLIILGAGPARGRRPASDPDPARFEAEIAAFESWDKKNAVPRDAVLFVGSSTIRLWPTAESFPHLPVVNRGFGGSHISDVNHFAQRIVLKYEPRVIVFYAGDNDIADGKSPQRVAGDFQAFVRRVQQRLPDTQIIYLSIKPSLARWKLWPTMQQANARVKKLCRGDHRLRYVDTAAAMLGPDARPRADLLLDDGLHLNAAGYREWTALLSPRLKNSR